MLIIQKRGAHGSSVLAGQIAVAAGSPRDESVRLADVPRANIKPAQPTSLRTKLRLGRKRLAL